MQRFSSAAHFRAALLALLTGVLPALSLIAALIFTAVPIAFADPQASVRMSTWPSYGKNVPFYGPASRERGESRSVKVELANTFLQVLIPLESRDVHIAQVFVTDAIRSINQGHRFVILGARDANSPIGTVALRRNGITSPAQYAGKKWGHSLGFSPERQLLKELAALSGFDGDSVKIIHMEYGVRFSALLAGQIDFMSAWWGSGYPPIMLTAERQNIELTYIRWTDFGVDVYGEVFVARRDWVEQQPELVRGFLRAASRAFLAAMADPAAAVDAAAAHLGKQGVEREIIRVGWQQSSELVWDAFGRKHGIFQIDEGKFLRTLEMMSVRDLDRPVTSYFTNEYLPAPPSGLAGSK
jgi:NitT/TauT family transport system substrate-binding protein